MVRVNLSGAPPSFSELRTVRRQGNPSSFLYVTDVALNVLDACIPFASVLPRLILLAVNLELKRKRGKLLGLCGRLQALHARAGGAAISNQQLPGDEWVAKYADLVLRFTVFAKKYEKKRRVLLRIARRVRGAADAQALDAFHREINLLAFELVR